MQICHDWHKSFTSDYGRKAVGNRRKLLHYIALHYITLHYTTLHYISLLIEKIQPISIALCHKNVPFPILVGIP